MTTLNDLTPSMLKTLMKKASQLDNQRAICKKYHQSDKGKIAKARAQRRWRDKIKEEKKAAGGENKYKNIDYSDLVLVAEAELAAEEAELAAEQAELDAM